MSRRRPRKAAGGRRNLQRELEEKREQLRTTTEDLMATNQEIRASNEELETVNAELNANNEKLGRANSDLANLLENIRVPILFLDRDLKIRTFTPDAKDLFHLIESDQDHLRPGRQSRKK